MSYRIDLAHACFDGLPGILVDLENPQDDATQAPPRDADYRGELRVFLQNNGTETQTVENGERIAQLVITPCLDIEIEETDELSETLRGAAGFGSTGTH